jgi:transposase InsO family protein
VALMRQLHMESNGTYGSPRMHEELTQEHGLRVGVKTIARLMARHGIRAVAPKRRYRVTTDSKHDHPMAPNHLNREFEAPSANLKWVTDITYIPTREGWLYLAVVLDLFSRKVVGYHMGKRITRQLIIAAANMALTRRQPKPGLLHHSDRGSQYASYDYREILDRTGMLASMSRKGNCWDNAVMESFFATLKKELIHRRIFQTRSEAMLAVFEYIEGW